jgi:hypothetical protein
MAEGSVHHGRISRNFRHALAEGAAMDPLSAIRDRFRDSFGDDSSKPTTSVAPPPPRTLDELPAAPTSDGARFVLARMKHEADTPPKKLAPSPRQMLDGKLVPLPGEIAGASTAGHVRLYTASPNERNVKKTPWDPKTLVPALQAAWPGLSETGARTLVCQITNETGFGGQNAYDYNFGNVKAKDDSQPHQYLQGTWEPYTPKVAAARIAQFAPSAHLATPEELSKHPGWKCRPEEQIVVFSPPSAPSRFRAFASFEAGVQGYVGSMKSYASKAPGLLDALNAGDTATAAHLLKKAGYYRGVESAYVTNMGEAKKMLEKKLGPVSR